MHANKKLYNPDWPPPTFFYDIPADCFSAEFKVRFGKMLDRAFLSESPLRASELYLRQLREGFQGKDPAHLTYCVMRVRLFLLTMEIQLNGSTPELAKEHDTLLQTFASLMEGGRE